MPQNIGDNRVVEDGIARITMDDAGRLRRYLVQTGDIVYSRRGDVEKRALIREKEDGWLCGTGCLRVRFGTHGEDPSYASYYLGHPEVRAWIVRHAQGATMPNLNTSILSSLPFVVPPIAEQRAIAYVLTTLDNKIELNRRMNETLEEMARAIFKSWFVDFDPVRAKAEGRDPGIPKHIADLFPDRFEESELGMMPAGWKVRSFAETVDILGGGTPKTSVPEYWSGEIPWYSVVDAPRDADVFVIDTEKKTTQAGIENSSARILPTGASIISARGTVGRVALVGSPMAMNQSCYGLHDSTSEHGYYTYFATRNLVAILQQRVHGAVFDTITRDTLRGVPITVPDREVIDAFEYEVAPNLERILANLRQSKALSEIRDAALPGLISGTLRVPNARKLIDEAMP